jgi:hypothetical protein
MCWRRYRKLPCKTFVLIIKSFHLRRFLSEYRLSSDHRLRLAEHEASASDSTRPYGPLFAPLRASHCTTAAVPTTLVQVRARSEAPTTHPGRPRSQPLRRSRASAQNQLGQEDRLHTGRSASEEDELLRPTLGTDTFDEENRRQRQEEGDRLSSSSSEHGRRGPTLFKYPSVRSTRTGRKWSCRRRPEIA